MIHSQDKYKTLQCPLETCLCVSLSVWVCVNFPTNLLSPLCGKTCVFTYCSLTVFSFKAVRVYDSTVQTLDT